MAVVEGHFAGDQGHRQQDLCDSGRRRVRSKALTHCSCTAAFDEANLVIYLNVESVPVPSFPFQAARVAHLFRNPVKSLAPCAASALPSQCSTL